MLDRKHKQVEYAKLDWWEETVGGCCNLSTQGRLNQCRWLHRWRMEAGRQRYNFCFISHECVGTEEKERCVTCEVPHQTVRGEKNKRRKKRRKKYLRVWTEVLVEILSTPPLRWPQGGQPGPLSPANTSSVQKTSSACAASVSKISVAFRWSTESQHAESNTHSTKIWLLTDSHRDAKSKHLHSPSESGWLSPDP